MTHHEFTAWLDGFLTGKISDADRALVTAKCKEMEYQVNRPVQVYPLGDFRRLADLTGDYTPPVLTTCCQ